MEGRRGREIFASAVRRTPEQVIGPQLIVASTLTLLAKTELRETELRETELPEAELPQWIEVQIGQLAQQNKAQMPRWIELKKRLAGK